MRQQTLAGATPSSTSPPRLWGGLVAIFLGLTVAIGLTGYFYTRYQASRQLEAARDALSSIADLKVGQISNWYNDRLVDARTMLVNRFIQEGAARFLAEPSSLQLGQDLFAWFSAVAELKHRCVFLYDAQGTMRLSAPPNAPAPNASQDPDFQAALHAGDLVVTDLQRDLGSGQEAQRGMHFNIWIPMRNSSTGESKAAGVLLLQIDPNNILFPLIQSWPTPSPTAETLLVRREGNDVVFLNELRHRKNTALTLRFPIESNPHLPAALAVKGEEGIVEGVDYQNVPVLAATRGIPGTLWFMVAKVDLDEIRAPMRRQAWTTISVLVALILAAALGVGLLGRRRDNEWLLQQLAVERERQVLAERNVLLNKHANDIILLADGDGKILEANDRALKAYGYPLEKLKSLTLGNLSGPDGGGKSVEGFMMESVHRCGNGTLFPVEINTHSVEIGGVTYNQSIIRDVTERKRAEETLREGEERMQFALMVSHTGAWDMDLVSHTAFRTIMHDQIFGYEKLLPEWTYGMFLEHVLPEDRAEVDRAFKQAMQEKGIWDFECRIVRRDGEQRWIWACGQYRPDLQGRHHRMAGIVQDITERKQATLALERVNTEIARKNRELEQIVYVASHDLRSPLVNVQGFSTELKVALEELRGVLKGADLPAEARAKVEFLLDRDAPESLAYILAGITKMDALISGLLRLSRLGRAALAIGPIDMNGLLAEVERTFEFQIQEAGATLSIGELPPCLGDAAQINQAFSNLVGNALKYLDPARPGVVRITGLSENGQSVYCIEDNGIGIEARHQAKIFELYHRLDPVASPGDGLGLTIVRTVLDRQHGRVWLESEPGIGSRFYVELPGADETGKDSE